MATNDPTDLLRFEPPEAALSQQWTAAEKAAVEFSQQLLDKARELKDCRQELNKAWEEKERLWGMVVRNLIDVADNCKASLDGPASAAADGAEEQTPGAPACGEIPLARVGLASTYRKVLHVLEELGVVPVDLQGRTYKDVAVDGQAIEDPFEVLHSEQTGKSTEATVREVVSDLWVSRRHGGVQVLRRGKVYC
jgi:hypothetical protein